MQSFKELKLISPIQRAIDEEGYTIPTPIQARTIPHALDGKDVLGVAQTGTGKTAAFALPILNHFADQKQKAVAKRPQALIIAPTRELAIQIAESVEVYGRYLKLKHAVIYGGVGQGRQVNALNSGVHIVIATPGRLLDLMNQKALYLNRLQIFVVDEADRMMDMGFLPDLKRIMKDLPIRRQSLFFSATMPPKIVALAEALLHHPTKVNVAPKKTSVELIDQRVIHAAHQQKKALLAKLILAGDVGQAIVFTRTKRGANSVAEFLRRQKIDAQPIHGNLSQNARQRVLEAFRSDKVQILVATDLASRGIDVDKISHVFNFELPNEPENYVHRIGRTGRAGEKGIAISLCSSEERSYLKDIEKHLGFKILTDGREPEPIAAPAPGEAPAKDGDGTAKPKSRRRRRTRTRGPKSPTATGAKPTGAPAGEAPRPTAAQRKAKRNRRRKKPTGEG